MRSGHINPSIAKLRNSGGIGNVWSLSAAPMVWTTAKPGVRSLVLESSNVQPSYGPTDRWATIPLRYLVRGGGDHTSDNLDHLRDRRL